MSAPAETHVVDRLSTLDRFLPLWIGLAMVAGLLLGRCVSGLDDALSAVEVDGISLPIAIGLLVMMYPVLAKVRYDRLDTVTADRRLLVSSLVLNWVVGPALMFTLAWLLLPDLPAYRTGLIIVGLARCIAMVIIWNDLACGDREAAAVLVALNSVFQVVAFAGLGWFYLEVLPGWLGLDSAALDVSAWQIAKSVLIFLGIPLLLGYLSRPLRRAARGREWYESALPAPHRPVGPVRPAVHHRGALRAAGRPDHQQAARRRPDRAAAAGVLRADVGRRLRPRHGARHDATSAPRRWRSPPPATTSSSPSPSRSRPSASPPARPSPAWSARSSRCPCWSASSTSASPLRDRFPHPPEPRRRPSDEHLPPSCSSASTTPAAPRWPPAGCATSPATASRCAPPAPRPPTTINPVAVRGDGARSASTSPAEPPKLLTNDAVRGLRRRHHHGLRRRLPVLPRQALRGLEARRPGRPGHRRGPPDPRRDPRPRSRSSSPRWAERRRFQEIGTLKSGVTGASAEDVRSPRRADLRGRHAATSGAAPARGRARAH